LVLCARTVVFLWRSSARCGSAAPLVIHIWLCLALLAAVVLPALASSSVTKLLVSYVPIYSLNLV
jgi:hypothetical protein